MNRRSFLLLAPVAALVVPAAPRARASVGFDPSTLAPCLPVAKAGTSYQMRRVPLDPLAPHQLTATLCKDPQRVYLSWLVHPAARKVLVTYSEYVEHPRHGGFWRD